MRKAIITSVQNFCNFPIIELIDLFMIVCDANLYFVEDCFSANEELTSCRVCAPYNCGRTINLSAESTSSSEPIQNIKIAREDLIFGVFEVGVFHALSMAGIGGHCKGVCATPLIVTGRWKGPRSLRQCYRRSRGSQRIRTPQRGPGKAAWHDPGRSWSRSPQGQRGKGYRNA